MTAQKLEKGRVVKTAGKTIKTRSGPLRGNWSRVLPLIRLMLPIYEKTTNAESRPHIIVKIGISKEALRISSDFFL